MKKIFTILIALTFFVYSGVCLAGSPKGLEKKGNATKGFTQGEKSGWDGEYPKGWDNLNGKEKEEWLLKHGLEKDKEGKVKKVQNKKQKEAKKENKKK
jgi:hypothetical protein